MAFQIRKKFKKKTQNLKKSKDLIFDRIQIEYFKNLQSLSRLLVNYLMIFFLKDYQVNKMEVIDRMFSKVRMLC